MALQIVLLVFEHCLKAKLHSESDKLRHRITVPYFISQILGFFLKNPGGFNRVPAEQISEPSVTIVFFGSVLAFVNECIS